MMAKALEANGAQVYIVGRRLEILQKAAEQAKHRKIIPLQGDVTKKEDLERIVAHIEKEVGYLNVLIANSGITGPSIASIPQDATINQFQEFLWNTPAEEFTNVLNVNTTAVYRCLVAFLGLLDKGNKKGNVEQKSQVIATSSIGAYNRRNLVSFAYAASKAGTTHIMKQFATSMVPYNIRSNVIAPGLYASEIAEEFIKQAESAGGFPKTFIPAQRAGGDADMAGAILYLCSRAGAYVNGDVVITDGGRLSIVPSSY